MKHRALFFAPILAGAALLAGCSNQYAKDEMQAKTMPINCATAQGDIRVLMSEKASTAQQAAAGVSAIVPAGAIVGFATGTEGTNAQIATGEYNKILDGKIAEIKAKCGM